MNVGDFVAGLIIGFSVGMLFLAFYACDIPYC